MKRLLHTPTALLLRRIALLYAVLMLCRVIFYLYNARLLGPLSWGELGQLLAGSLKFDTASVVYANGVLVLLSLLPLHVRERKWYRRLLFWYYAVVNAVLVVAVNMADCVYFRYTQKRFTADEIFFADNGNSLQLVGKFMAENWYLVIAAAALTALLVRGPAAARCATASLPEPGLGLLCGRHGDFRRRHRTLHRRHARRHDPHDAADHPLQRHALHRGQRQGQPDSEQSVLHPAHHRQCGQRQLPEILPARRAAARRFTPVHRPADSTAVNLAGRNVVIFIMESMSAEHSAHLMPEIYADRKTKGFTPFLDSLMRSGLCFKRMYANGTRSIQAMPSVLGSIPSFKTPFVLMPQSLGESRQLPAILRDKGYATVFFCGSERGSMGFGAYARSAGVERLVSREDYEARHGKEDFDGYWGIWDEPFLQFMGEELSETPEPFFATLFTLSSHHPFVVPARYENTLPDGYTKIHKGVAYDDNAFRLFFERFGREEWFRRTVFVFVADHVSSEKFAPVTRTYPGNYHIIGFMYTPDGALRGEVGDIVQQLDIMPTVLGLVGSEEPYFAFGRDVLNEPERPRWSVSYDGKFRALTGEGAVVLDDSGPQVQECPVTPAADSLMQSFRALIQQYYSHIERKSYTPDD